MGKELCFDITVIVYLTKQQDLQGIVKMVDEGMKGYLKGKDYGIIMVNASGELLDIKCNKVFKVYNISRSIVDMSLFKLIKDIASMDMKSIVVINGDNKEVNEDLVGGLASPTLMHDYVVPMYYNMNPLYNLAYSLITYPVTVMLYGLNITCTHPLDFGLGKKMIEIIKENDYDQIVPCNFSIGSLMNLIALVNGLEVVVAHVPPHELDYEQYYGSDQDLFIKELIPLLNIMEEYELSWLRIKPQLSYPAEAYVAKRFEVKGLIPHIDAITLLQKAKVDLNKYIPIYSEILKEKASEVLRQLHVNDPKDLDINDDLWSYIVIRYLTSMLKEPKITNRIEMIKGLVNLTLVKASQIAYELEKAESVKERMTKLAEEFLRHRDEFIKLLEAG